MTGETSEIHTIQKIQIPNETFWASISTNQRQSASKLDSQKENLQLALIIRIKKVAFVSIIAHQHYKSSFRAKNISYPKSLVGQPVYVLEMHLKI